MAVKDLMATRKFGFLGTGNMSQTVIGALTSSNTVSSDRIWATNRTDRKLKKAVDAFGIHALKNNEELVDECDVIVLAVKPQDLYSALEPIASSFTEDQVVISLAAGISLSSLSKLLPTCKQIIRVMPNTPARIRKGVLGYCTAKEAEGLGPFIEALLAPLGYVVKTSEGEEFEALTVSTSSGVGFVFELMLYWQEWLEEHGFEADVARKMTQETFLGAASLAAESESLSINELQNKVVSKKGVTAAGLDSMRELEVERLLRYSFEKAVLRDRELGKTSV